MSVTDLLPDFGGARDVATIEEMVMEAAGESGAGKRQVGVAEFDS